AECETGYNGQAGMECYEKTRADAVILQPASTELLMDILPRAHEDQIPVLSPGYGLSAIADGSTFRWAFNPPSSYWDGASMILRHISGGDLDRLGGKKIAFLYLDHAFGREALPL